MPENGVVSVLGWEWQDTNQLILSKAEVSAMDTYTVPVVSIILVLFLILSLRKCRGRNRNLKRKLPPGNTVEDLRNNFKNCILRIVLAH